MEIRRLYPQGSCEYTRSGGNDDGDKERSRQGLSSTLERGTLAKREKERRVGGGGKREANKEKEKHQKNNNIRSYHDNRKGWWRILLLLLFFFVRTATEQDCWVGFKQTRKSI